MKARLGVNIDHVATLRQARGEGYPSVVEAAKAALRAGADQITIHLREDRRHIQDTDVPAVKLVTEKFGKPLNLEIGANPEIISIAVECRPEWICLVPEKREEKTTEGGLNLLDPVQFERIKGACERLKKEIPGVKISLFVEADEAVLEKCGQLEADAVEIHTGDYARDFQEDNPVEEHLERFAKGKEIASMAGLGYHAGHGLTDESLRPLANQGVFAEYNIGHWIICDAVFCGLEKSVEKLKQTLQKGQ